MENKTLDKTRVAYQGLTGQAFMGVVESEDELGFTFGDMREMGRDEVLNTLAACMKYCLQHDISEIKAKDGTYTFDFKEDLK